MPLVAAKCTSCGAPLTVDNSKEAAICQFCGTPFILEKAIANITISGSNHVTEEFERQNNYDTALQFYHSVLHLEGTNANARNAIDRINNNVPVLVLSYIAGFLNPGTLILTRKSLTCQTKKSVQVYPIETITSVSRFDARLKITINKPSTRLSLAIGDIAEATAMERAINRLIRQE